MSREVSGVHLPQKTSAVSAGDVWQRPYTVFGAWCSRFPYASDQNSVDQLVKDEEFSEKNT